MMSNQNKYMLVKYWVDCNTKPSVLKTWFTITGWKKALSLFNLFAGTESHIGYCCVSRYELVKIPEQLCKYQGKTIEEFGI